GRDPRGRGAPYLAEAGPRRARAVALQERDGQAPTAAAGTGRRGEGPRARGEAPGGGTGAPKFLEAVWAYKVLDVAARERKPHEVEVQAVVRGADAPWVSLPGEIFVELGLALKLDSPYRTTIVTELANGAIGYIPSRRAYAQGNYEVVSARCAEGSGERLVNAAVKLLNELHAETRAATNR